MHPAKNISPFRPLLLGLALLCCSIAYPQAHSVPPIPEFVQVVEKAKLPPSLEYTGEFKWALTWTEYDSAQSDKKRQVLIASEVNHPDELRNDLYLVQYGFGNGRYGVQWTLKEYAPKLCRVELLEKSLQIIDLDGDGKHEVSFAYQVRHPEPEPSLLKVMLYHKGEKIVVRGKKLEGKEAQILEKSIVEEERQVMQWYLEKRWEEVLAEKEPFMDLIWLRGENWFLLESRSVEGLQRIFYELYDQKGQPILQNPASNEDGGTLDSLHTRLRTARAVYPTPRGNLMYVADEGVGTIDPRTAEGKSLLELPETTEGISTAAWSPDSSKVALVVLNIDAYPQSTRLFVLSIDGSAPPQEFDILVSHYGFDEWTIEPPVFVDDGKVKVLQVGDDEVLEGEWREIGLR